MDSGGNTLAGGLPHSEIRGSKGARPSPRLIAACHVLHRLSVPRHPPDALLRRLISLPRAGTRSPRNKRDRKGTLRLPGNHLGDGSRPRMRYRTNAPLPPPPRPETTKDRPRCPEVSFHTHNPIHSVQHLANSRRRTLVFSHRIQIGGGGRDRTDDLMLAKHVLSQLSYAPERRLIAGVWWAWEDLNFRPHAYQARALTN